MPTSRLVLLLICLIILPTFLTFFSLLYSHPRDQTGLDPSAPISRSGLRAFFSFHTPSSLFPSSAIISLTDDNSTFFLARPADFGSRLPSDGLSAQLWVGSGFGDDGLARGGPIAVAEGELGCTDVPGWEDGNRHNHGDIGMTAHTSETSKTNKVSGTSGGTEGTGFSSTADQAEDKISEDDGTDDHLHHPLPGSKVSKPVRPGEPARNEFSKNGAPPAHADIQSLQESAEIAGKVVLLSRGGCGFLEKAKWVQRRGGTALIVGDDTRGGELLTMYARGDTSNVTIPSLFTSHTTAHLLSSLIPAGGSTGGFLSGRNKWRVTQSQGKAGSFVATEKENSQDNSDGDRPTFTPSSNLANPTHLSQSSVRTRTGKRSVSKQNSALKRDENKSWLTLIASSLGIRRKSLKPNLSADSRRPPSSGRLSWVSEKWVDESQKGSKVVPIKDAGSKIQSSSKTGGKSATPQSSNDDFIIGVQDWRDPDLIMAESSQGQDKHKTDGMGNKIKPSGSKAASTFGADSKDAGNTLTGGIITPGSGEYGKSSSIHYDSDSYTVDRPQKSTGQDETIQKAGDSRTRPNELLTGQGFNDPSLVSGTSHRVESNKNEEHKTPIIQAESSSDGDDSFERYHSERREGLWVTLTPNTISTSPFFDTLLVLVVSPLVTLTVVYALLLLRSRIRRRRWRAPKSVVDRLPVRTYHTMSCSSTSSSSRFASPKASSPTTPLLQANPQSVLACPRPRSRTTSGIDGSQSISVSKAATKASLARCDKNPRPQVFPKKYTARQIECVVCLEEYVDGHSRVMSLPCGHEFHAECM